MRNFMGKAWFVAMQVALTASVSIAQDPLPSAKPLPSLVGELQPESVAVPLGEAFSWTVRHLPISATAGTVEVLQFLSLGAECDPPIFSTGMRLDRDHGYVQGCRRISEEEVRLVLTTTVGKLSVHLPALPSKPSLGPALFVERLIELQGVVSADRIVFKPGGKIRVPPGKELTLSAFEILAEGDGATIDIDGRGEEGRPGDSALPCAACEQGRNWRTQDAAAFEQALQQCNEQGERAGRAGNNGHPGGVGATVVIKAERIVGTVICDVQGGRGGVGGLGSLGQRLELDSVENRVVECPTGRTGLPGSNGPSGTCTVRRAPGA